jgi:hypothetical protein
MWKPEKPTRDEPSKAKQARLRKEMKQSEQLHKRKLGRKPKPDNSPKYAPPLKYQGVKPAILPTFSKRSDATD